MSLEISQAAAKWYKEEFDLEDGDYVRFFVQLYGGIPTSHPNYFLAVSVGKEGQVAMSQTVEGITFYVNENDKWILEQFHMTIDLKDGEAHIKLEEK